MNGDRQKQEHVGDHRSMRMSIRTCWAMPVAATCGTAQTQPMPTHTIATLVNLFRRGITR